MSEATAELMAVDLMPEGVREDLAPLAASIRERKSAAVESLIEMGRVFAEARARLSSHHRGIFVRWVEEECGMSWMSATRCIRAAEVWGEVSFNTVLKLEPTALYLLSAPSCPPEAREEAETIAQSGDPVTAKLARELVEKHRPPEEDEEMDAIEVAEAIRKAMRKVFDDCPAALRAMVPAKFKEYAEELAKTGDLSW